MSNENMQYKYPKECPCCGEGIISDLHDICLVCGWEDDDVQNEVTTFRGGANKQSLEEHRASFLELRRQNKKYQWGDRLK